MNRRILTATLMLAASGSVFGASLNYTSGELTSIYDINVNGILYDVKFVDDSAYNLYYNETTSSFEFDILWPETAQFSYALLDAFNASDVTDYSVIKGGGYSYYDDFSGKEISTATLITLGAYEPERYNPELVKGSAVFLNSSGGNSVSEIHLIGYEMDLTSSLSITYADWSLAGTERDDPEPLTCVLENGPSYIMRWSHIESARSYVRELNCDVSVGVDSDSAVKVAGLLISGMSRLNQCDAESCVATVGSDDVSKEISKVVSRNKVELGDGESLYLACSAKVSGKIGGPPREYPSLEAACRK